MMVSKEKTQAYRQLAAAKESSVDAKLRAKYPALFWAKKYHRNTRNEAMNFADMYYQIGLYRDISSAEQMVVMKCVQTGLSELFIISSLLEAAEKGFTVMYVLPKYELRNRFVNNRIDKLMRRVGYYAQLVREAGGTDRTSMKHVGKGTIVYVGSNVVDEFIEIPVDSAYVDELDRCNQSNLLLLPDRLTASPYKYFRQIGNPTIEGFGIAAAYDEGSQGSWQMKCPHCGKWFEPDFYKHVIRDTGVHTFEVRDEQFDEEGRVDARVVHDCGGFVDRLAIGEWVHGYPRREVRSYQISKVSCKYVSMKLLLKKYRKALGHALKLQVFNNSDLGRPHTAEGARITRAMLNKCIAAYQYPAPMSAPAGIRTMGVDVGDSLHVVIRDRIGEKSAKRKLVYAAAIPTFDLLEQLIKQFRPRIVVIDAGPELHKVQELKEKFKFIYSSLFVETMAQIHIDKKDRELKMNRTMLLDYVKQSVDLENFVLPIMAEGIDGGEYYEQVCASTRILEANETNPERSRYVWEHSHPDHYFLAEAYNMQADFLVPYSSVFDFFKGEAARMHGMSIDKDLQSQGEPDVSEEERRRIRQLQGMDSMSFLYSLSKHNKPPSLVSPRVKIVTGDEVKDKEQP